MLDKVASTKALKRLFNRFALADIFCQLISQLFNKRLVLFTVDKKCQFFTGNHTPGGQIGGSDRRDHTVGHYNLGMAHKRIQKYAWRAISTRFEEPIDRYAVGIYMRVWMLRQYDGYVDPSGGCPLDRLDDLVIGKIGMLDNDLLGSMVNHLN